MRPNGGLRMKGHIGHHHSSPVVSPNDTTVQRLRILGAFVFVANALVLMLYPDVLQPRLLAWAQAKPESSDVAYYTQIFQHLSIPIFFSVLIAGLAILYARKLVYFAKPGFRSTNWLLWILVLVAAMQIFIAVKLDTIPHSDSGLLLTACR